MIFEAGVMNLQNSIESEYNETSPKINPSNIEVKIASGGGKWEWDPEDAKKYKTFDEWLNAHPAPNPDDYPMGRGDLEYIKNYSYWVAARNAADRFYRDSTGKPRSR